MNSDFVETRILAAVRSLLSVRVNELLRKVEYSIPLIELGEYRGDTVVSPEIALSCGERTEKERIILLDAYTVTVTFSLPEAEESELYCYAYAAAVRTAIREDPTLGGTADRAVITAKKYTTPKSKHCADGFSVSIALRITTGVCK